MKTIFEKQDKREREGLDAWNQEPIMKHHTGIGINGSMKGYLYTYPHNDDIRFEMWINGKREVVIWI